MTATADELLLLRAVCEVPADDTRRLVYADYLDEHARAERAEFVRAQVLLAKWEQRPGDDFTVRADGKVYEFVEPDTNVNLAALRRRERELFTDLNAMEWCRSLGRGYVEATAGGVSTGLIYGAHPNDRTDFAVEFRRGFVAAVTCAAADWRRHHEGLYWHPGQTELCGCAGVREWTQFPHKTARCPRCDGRRTIPRPFVPTAHPVEAVTLTTPLEHRMMTDSFHPGRRRFSLTGLRSHVDAPEGVYPTTEELLAAEWPGIKFTLPAAETFEAARRAGGRAAYRANEDFWRAFLGPGR